MARVLIIDNDTKWRVSKLHDALEPLGHELVCESDRELAINLIRTETFDLAVLNVHLNDREENHTTIRQDCIEMIDKAVNRGIRVLVVTEGARLCPRREDYELTTAVTRDYHGDMIFKEEFSEIRFRDKVTELVKFPLPMITAPNTLLDLGWPAPTHRFPWNGTVDFQALRRKWQERDVSLLDVIFVENVGKVINATCRIERSDGNPDGDGTGFAIAPNLILTCNHVVSQGVKPHTYRARFRFRYSSSGVLEQGSEFWVKRVVRWSGVDNLDFSLLEVEGRPGDESEIGYVKLKHKTPAIDDLAFVVQYPKRRPQKICLFHNWVEWVDTRCVQYLTHTTHGASGAPVFDKNGDILALHHAETETPGPSLAAHIRGGEGIPISAILARISNDLPYR